MFKEKIKSLLPDQIIYIYQLLKTVPNYLAAQRELKNLEFPEINMISNKETVDCIVNKKMSLSRFGDGEFLWMMGTKYNSFEKYSPELAEKLCNTMKSKNPNLLIGIPGGMIDSSKCNLYARMHWQIIKKNYFYDIVPYLNLNRVFCDASITRPYIDYNDREFSRQSFENLKRIWDSKDIVIVEGSKTKLGLGNDLFANAKSIKRIICPSQNAFSRIGLIENAIEQYVDKNTIMLAALGPTATILASDMCDKGYQVIDIGHIDIEYMWYLNHAILRDKVSGKSVNESGSRDCDSVYDRDKSYLESIICSIE